MKYRVHYPLITRDAYRDFETKPEAEAFAGERRNAAGNMWRHVRIEPITLDAIDRHNVAENSDPNS